MGDDDVIVVRAVVGLQSGDDVLDGLIAVFAAADHPDPVPGMGDVFRHQILGVVDPVGVGADINLIKAGAGQKFLQRVDDDGLVAQGQKLLGHVRHMHPGAHAPGQNRAKNHGQFPPVLQFVLQQGKPLLQNRLF